MAEIQLGAVEARFADIIWEREPVTSTELTKLAAAEFTWKRTTTHTVLRRLCDKGLFQNKNGTVTSLVSRQEFYARHSKKYVEETFHGSLPAFLAAFTSGKRLTAEEVAQLHQLIDKAGESDE
jgi:predicted transcriptional regulator